MKSFLYVYALSIFSMLSTGISASAFAGGKFQTDSSGLNMPPTMLLGIGADAKFPSVAVSNTGTAMALFSQVDGDSTDGVVEEDLMSCFFDGSVWQACTPVDFGIDAYGTVVEAIEIIADDAGNFVAVWRERDGASQYLKMRRYFAGIGWEGASSALVAGGVNISTVANRHLAILDVNHFAITYLHDSDPSQLTSGWVEVKVYDEDIGGLQTALKVTDSVNDTVYSAIAMNSDGGFWVAYQEKVSCGTDCFVYGSVYVRRYSPNSGWIGQPTPIKTNVARMASNLRIVSDKASGRVALGWLHRSNASYPLALVAWGAYYNGTNWSVSQLGASSSAQASGITAKIDANGTAFFSWIHDHDATGDADSWLKVYKGSWNLPATRIDLTNDSADITYNPNRKENQSYFTTSQDGSGVAMWLSNGLTKINARRLVRIDSAGKPVWNTQEQNFMGSNTGTIDRIYDLNLNSTGTLGAAMWSQRDAAGVLRPFINLIR